LTNWGNITALSVDSSSGSIALAAGRRIGLIPPGWRPGDEEPRVSWEASTQFHTVWMEFHKDRLYCAGYSREKSTTPDTSWEKLDGGGWTALDTTSGRALLENDFAIRPAWGNGSDPLGICHARDLLIAVDRTAALHFWNTNTGAYCSGYGDNDRAERNRGLAHMKVTDELVMAGFNRDGYQVHVYELGDGNG